MSARNHCDMSWDILDITQDDIDTSVRSSFLVESGITKDNTSFRGADFDSSSDMMEPVGANSMWCRSLDKFQISKGSEIDR